jgi:serine protease AprX
MSRSAQLHVSHRPRRWRRALVLATAIATLSPLAAIAGTSAASAATITACPTNSTDLAAMTDASWSAKADLHSMYSAEGTVLGSYASGKNSIVRRGTGASTYYSNGYFGQGIGVALVDTGVAPGIAGLTNGNVVQGIDLSFDSQAGFAVSPGVANLQLPHNDAYGHGTHLAGIIAGSDAASPNRIVPAGTPTTYSGWNDPTQFTGMAPLSHVVDVRVGDSQGAVDVTQVIAAIDWVVKHRNDPGMNIRVLNLSYGLQANDEQKVDALSYAVDQAWKAGIVVVAADGNGGLAVQSAYNPGVTSPGYNNDIITVGPYDPATMLVPAFSS